MSQESTQQTPSMDPATKVQWHSRSVDEVADLLRTQTEFGLLPEEAAARFEASGPNELPTEAGPGLAFLILRQLNDFLILLLIGAAVVSVMIGEWVDAAVVISIVILNAILGVSQEMRAERALDALRQLAAPLATVIRAGQALRLPSRELVPGDLIVLETGDFVPADVRLITSANLKIDESALTGESVPVEKQAATVLGHEIPIGDRRNSGFAGTVVTYGRGRGIVVGTGPHTQLGLIAGMLQAIETEPTPLQKALTRLGRSLGLATLAICGVVFVTGLLRGGEVLELFMIAVSLAVAAVPEGLPAVVTIVLAMGMQRMVSKHVIIRRLPAVETLGSITVICSDKTGTLTQNQMTVVKIWSAGTTYDISGEGYRPRGEFFTGAAGPEGSSLADPLSDEVLAQCLRVGMLCTDALLQQSGEAAGEETWRIVGDPTEGSLVVAARKAGLDKLVEENNYPRIAEVPFDSSRKRMSTLHRQPDKRVLVCSKGAPDILLGLCEKALSPDGRVIALNDAMREQVLTANHRFASEALRVLGLADKIIDTLPSTIDSASVESELVFLGLVAMVDPVRPEAVKAVERCRRAGITPVMITGDYRDTALAVGKVLGMVVGQGDVVTGEQLARMSQAELIEKAKVTSIYARVAPEHKVQIVDALKEGSGHIVAMTGDGVNDAMALKRSDIGVAMGITGTDVAKETSDMILTDDNFASIVSAVEEGRRIFANIRKFVFFLLSCNVGEVLIVFSAIIIGLPMPLRPIHLLWLNLVTDSLPALAIGLEKAEPNIMEQPPRNPREPIINRLMTRNIAIQATVEAVATLAAFAWAWRSSGDIVFSQTVAFSTLVVAELLRAFTARSDTYNVWQIGILSNPHVVWASMISFGLLTILLYLPQANAVFGTVPLNVGQWRVIVALAAAPAVSAEITKLVTRRRPSGQ